MGYKIARMKKGIKFKLHQINFRVKLHHMKLMRRLRVAKDGTPQKCPCCGSNDLEVGSHYTEEPYGLVEYDMICKKCNRKVGTWRYGEWIYNEEL